MAQEHKAKAKEEGRGNLILTPKDQEKKVTTKILTKATIKSIEEQPRSVKVCKTLTLLKRLNLPFWLLPN